jgi:leader peptidase (prepilin peptidase)/N-methyltransferase
VRGVTWALAILGALAGAAVGSFLGCAAYRLPRRYSLNGRSFCPCCGKLIPAYRNLPILTYCLQRGRSACCGVTLHLSYVLFEAGCAAVGVLLAVAYGWQTLMGVSLAVIFAVGVAGALRVSRR